MACPQAGMAFEIPPTLAPRMGMPRHWSSMSADLISNAKLMALLRRYMMEHSKSSTRSVCLCPICVDARKLLDKAFGEKPTV